MVPPLGRGLPLIAGCCRARTALPVNARGPRAGRLFPLRQAAAGLGRRDFSGPAASGRCGPAFAARCRTGLRGRSGHPLAVPGLVASLHPPPPTRIAPHCVHCTATMQRCNDIYPQIFPFPFVPQLPALGAGFRPRRTARPQVPLRWSETGRPAVSGFGGVGDPHRARSPAAGCASSAVRAAHSGWAAPTPQGRRGAESSALSCNRRAPLPLRCRPPQKSSRAARIFRG
jgi:hypothetical protein